MFFMTNWLTGNNNLSLNAYIHTCYPKKLHMTHVHMVTRQENYV